MLNELYTILRGRYQLNLKAGFSSPAQVCFFLICMGDTADAGYRLRVMPRPIAIAIFQLPNMIWYEV